MLFNSITFLVFAIAFYSLWPWMRAGNTRRWVYLTAASFVFYGWWDWRFLFLILFSGFIDYFAGLAMVRAPQRRRLWLVLSLAGNIGSLGIFKYSHWLAGCLDRGAAMLGFTIDMADRIPSFALILPVGISFYTFQSMSYTLDIYRGSLKPTRNVFHFFAYLSMFPQLVAGPIIRARDLLHQLAEERRATGQRLWHGLRLVATGLFQKMVLADHLGVIVNQAFNDPAVNTSTVYWWLVMLSFGFQIYFDFSGYSQIARGLAKWMGLHFKMNFNHPYLATSIRDFWSRWHISLSQWFRDYLYIPLGGSRKGKGRAMANMWVVMLVSGLWHGANATFLLWGACHALFLTIERLCWSWYRKIPLPVRHLIVLFQVLVAWVFFRSVDTGRAMMVFQNMFTYTPTELKPIAFYDSYFFLALAVLFEGAYALSQKWKPLRRLLRNRALEAAEVGILLAASVFFRGPEAAFIYFQF